MGILIERYREIAVDAVTFRNPWVMVSPTKLPVAVAAA